jgi:hypothetical protein
VVALWSRQLVARVAGGPPVPGTAGGGAGSAGWAVGPGERDHHHHFLLLLMVQPCWLLWHLQQLQAGALPPVALLPWGQGRAQTAAAVWLQRAPPAAARPLYRLLLLLLLLLLPGHCCSCGAWCLRPLPPPLLLLVPSAGWHVPALPPRLLPYLLHQVLRQRLPAPGPA